MKYYKTPQGEKSQPYFESSPMYTKAANVTTLIDYLQLQMVDNLRCYDLKISKTVLEKLWQTPQKRLQAAKISIWVCALQETSMSSPSSIYCIIFVYLLRTCLSSPERTKMFSPFPPPKLLKSTNCTTTDGLLHFKHFRLQSIKGRGCSLLNLKTDKVINVCLLFPQSSHMTHSSNNSSTNYFQTHNVTMAAKYSQA